MPGLQVLGRCLGDEGGAADDAGEGDGAMSGNVGVEGGVVDARVEGVEVAEEAEGFAGGFADLGHEVGFEGGDEVGGLGQLDACYGMSGCGESWLTLMLL